MPVTGPGQALDRPGLGSQARLHHRFDQLPFQRHHEGVPRFFLQHEADPAAFFLFVPLHGPEDGLGGNPRGPDGVPQPLDQGPHLFGVTRIGEPQPEPRVQGPEDAPGHRLPVGEAGETGGGLEPVGEGVPQVQMGPDPFLGGIPDYEGGFHQQGPPGEFQVQSPVLPGGGGEEVSAAPGQKGKKLRVPQHARFQHFRQAGQVLPLGKAGEKGGGNEDLLRRVESPHHVFPAPEIDGGLSAEGGVRHGQKTGGDQLQPGAPHEERGREGGDITDHAPADAHEDRIPRHPPGEGGIENDLHAGPFLGPLTPGQHNGVVRGGGEKPHGSFVEDMEPVPVLPEFRGFRREKNPAFPAADDEGLLSHGGYPADSIMDWTIRVTKGSMME